MRGSWAYAHDLSEDPDVSVVAMIQMDMIGWHPAGAKDLAFEIHSTGGGSHGYTDSKYGSDALANTILRAMDELPSLTPALTPQMYPRTNCPDDPADDRSDHSRFHYYDWSACLVCEDLWSDLCGGSDTLGNQNYHSKRDLPDTLDADYAAAIAQIVAAATWMIANPERS
jgi:hypothetical protein